MTEINFIHSTISETNFLVEISRLTNVCKQNLNTGNLSGCCNFFFWFVLLLVGEEIFSQIFVFILLVFFNIKNILLMCMTHVVGELSRVCAVWFDLRDLSSWGNFMLLFQRVLYWVIIKCSFEFDRLSCKLSF